MTDPKPYVIRIYAGPYVQYLAVAGDEDDQTALPRTADPAMAATFCKFGDARKAAMKAAAEHPGHQFKVFPKSDVEAHHD